MGLDMYIFARKKDEPIDEFDINQISVYWRKAWEIRGWLVHHGIIEDDDNCHDRPISRDQIALLKRECDVLLSVKNDIKFFMDLAANYGFSIESDLDIMFDTLKETSRMLSGLLYAHDDDEFIYYDSWQIDSYYGQVLLQSN